MDSDIINVRYYTDYPVCNYSCEYCIAGHGITYDKPISSWNTERFKKIIKNIKKLPFRINIRLGVGGEFFLDKDLIEGAKLLSWSDNTYSVNLITNLSFTIEQYEQIFKDFNRKKIAVLASFHPTQIEDIDEWIKTSKYMNEHYSFCCVLIAFPDLIDKLSYYKKLLTDEGISVFVQSYLGPYNGKNYPEEYTDYERKIIKECIYSRHDWEFLVQLKKPGLCNAGFKSLFINPLGKVFPCGMGSYEKSLGDLSQSSEITLNDSPLQCPFKTCQCDTENMNTVIFQKHYKFDSKNQHMYSFRNEQISKSKPFLSEWECDYSQ